MGTDLASAASAVWLGVLTSLGPCSLATNLAALAFLGRRAGDTRAALASGLLYTLGRSAVYVALAVLLVTGLLSAPAVALPLQRYMPRFLGPLLILVGMVLLEMLTFGGLGTGGNVRAGERGLWGAGLLGATLALAFCPVSAALFFGSLLPLAVHCESPVALPALYGLGTALPVLACAGAVACGTRAASKLFNGLSGIELWVRRGTGGALLLLGLYLSLRHIYGLVF